MQLDVLFSVLEVDEMQMRDKNIVVIDILRSSTTIAYALANGAREIIPVATIENASKMSGSVFGDATIRGGERNGKIIQGFNLGNSPLEYSEENVKGKTIIFCTTNGTVALVKSRHARNLVVGGFVNLTTTIEFVKEKNEDFVFLCAGRGSALSGFSLEDTICAGMMIHKLIEEENCDIILTDSALAAKHMYKGMGRSIPKILKNSEHGKYLIEIGFKEDIKICGNIDSVPVLPTWIGNALRLRKENSGNENEIQANPKPSN